MQKVKWKDLSTSAKLIHAMLTLQSMNLLVIGWFFADDASVWTTVACLLAIVAMYVVIFDGHRVLNRAARPK